VRLEKVNSLDSWPGGEGRTRLARHFPGCVLRREIVVLDPADDYFAGSLVADLAVELEQAQIVAIGTFFCGGVGQVCSELR